MRLLFGWRYIRAIFVPNRNLARAARREADFISHSLSIASPLFYTSSIASFNASFGHAARPLGTEIATGTMLELYVIYRILDKRLIKYFFDLLG